jgi:inward rectifier potassium channel
MATKKNRATFTKDGLTAARRVGIDHLAVSEIYNALVTMSWSRFFLFVFLIYFSLTLVFTLLYAVTGFDNFSGLHAQQAIEKFVEVFLYNAQTLSTVGGAGIVPTGMQYNIILTIESMVAMLGMAMITGLLYVRFASPSAGIVCSDHILLSPYKDGQALMLRVANARKNELVELHVMAFLVKNDLTTNKRDVRVLELERSYLPFMAHPLTIVHPLTKESPLHNFDFRDTELFQWDISVWFNGIDRVTGQNVFAGRTYFLHDIIHNARFRSCVEVDGQGMFIIYMDKVGDYEKLSE